MLSTCCTRREHVMHQAQERRFIHYFKDTEVKICYAKIESSAGGGTVTSTATVPLRKSPTPPGKITHYTPAEGPQAFGGFIYVLDHFLNYYNIVVYFSNIKTMTTITVPLNTELNEFINEQVKLGKVPNKAELVRAAILKYKEDALITELLKAKQEAKEGKLFTGDLDTLAKRF